MTDSIYDFTVETLDGEERDLREHEGKVMLVVNTASRCGLTPQLGGLEALYQELRGEGFVVLGFPCNQFGKQEPGTAEEIGAFCQRNYGVTFPMYAKIEVNGAGTHPLYEHLKSARRGLLGTATIKWNFTKFLVDRGGEVVRRYGPKVAPRDIESDARALL